MLGSLCALTLLLSPLPSYAGHWEITLKGNTVVPGSTGTGNYTFANSQVNGPAPYSATSHIYFDVSGGSCALGLPGTLYIAATLTWKPDSPIDTSQPPPTLDLLETVSASDSAWILQPTGVSTSASDGFDDPVINPTAPVYGAGSKGKHLYHLVVSPGQTSVTLPLRVLSASLSYATAITSSSSSAGISYVIQPDTRSVTISADCDPTSYKLLTGGLDANGDGYVARFVHKPEEMKGDIGIPFGEQHTVTVDNGLGGTSTKLVVNEKTTPVTYRGHLGGTWATQNSHYWWKSSLKNWSKDQSLYRVMELFPTTGPPGESEIDYLTNVYVGPTIDGDTGAIIPNEVGAGGATDTLSFKYQNGDNRPNYPTRNDGDGAIATASYTLKLHRLVESFPSHKPADTVYRIATAFPLAGIDPLTGQMDIPMTIDSPGYTTYGTDGTNGAAVNVHLNNPSVAWDNAINTLSVFSSIPFPGKVGLLDVLFGGGSVLLSINKPSAETHSVSYSEGAWNDPWSTGQGGSLRSKYRMFPRFRVRYKRTYSLFDNYDAKGFQSETLTYLDTFVQNDSSFGYFQYVP